MGNYENDIEFDFFDEEPETQEATPRRRRPAFGGGRGDGPPRRPPVRPPTGAVALARLVGLVAIAIAIVVGLVFWVGACQGQTKHDEYAAYTDQVRMFARSSHQVGVALTNKLISPDLKLADLETSLEQWSQQEQQAYDQAQLVRPPGPLRLLHQRLLDTLELRAMGLAGLATTLTQTAATKKNTATAAADLTAQAELLTASDVVWTNLYRQPATDELKRQGITGVVVPPSQFVTNADLLTNRSFTLILGRLANATGTSSGGPVTGLHGSSLVGTKATPQGISLSTTSPTTIKVSADLAFAVTFEDSGNFQEVSIPVTLKIDTGSGKPIVHKQTVPVIQPSEQKTISFGNLQLPTSAFGNKVTLTVTIGKVPGETRLDNNTASYPVFFTLG
ncbi:MAG TPA: hypothetical protein VJ986_09430 [Gaiellaceae bacterium]|nr:hypothetical protein [Gaiellaceae bacterium]